MRVFTAHTPVPDMLFHAMTGREEISRLFQYRLSLASLDNSIPMQAMLGQSVTIEVEREDRSRRYINACVTEFSQSQRFGRYFIYEALLQPQLFFLTLTNDFRIFQKMTARDIVKKLLSENGIQVKDQLTGYYRMRDYTVQYNESTFNFISRLLEEEGASYWFEHAMGVHTMVLSDSISSRPILPSHAAIPYYPEGIAGIPDCEHISFWGISQTVNTGKLTLRDYDFKKPKADLNVIQPYPRSHPHSRQERYHYPGGYREAGDGTNYARVQAEALQTTHERATGRTNVRGFAVGYRFNLTNCPRKDQNREYLIVAADIDWADNSYETGVASSVVVHETSFNVQPTSETFRPERLTPYPVAYASDTAIVTGPPGQEIWVDEYNRIKVQMAWDREGKFDENSSCWIRVEESWSGSQRGTITIPRIGDECRIEYINGNPDHPIVTGRFYNADNMPPWKLPQNATQSGILTRWSKGGGGGNRLRFEDKRGEEHLELSTDYGYTQLNMGYLKNQGNHTQRGYGFELRTNLWGSVRADKGLLLSTYTQDHTTQHASDNVDGHEALGEALASGKARAEASQQAMDMLKDTITQQVQSGVSQLLGALAGSAGGLLSGLASKAVSNAAGGGKETLLPKGHDPAMPEADLMHEYAKKMDKPIVSVASPEGQTLHSPKPVIVGSGQSVSIHAKNHITMTSASQLSVMAAKGMSTHVESGGQSTVVSKGDWATRVTTGAANVIAQDNITVSSQAADVNVCAKNKVVVVSQSEDVVIAAAKSITLVCGKSLITMDAEGNITIQGKNGAVHFSDVLDQQGKEIKLNC